MQLIDLLAVINDNQFVVVTDSEDKEIARYDGRDSIDDIYNNKEVISVSAYPETMGVIVAWIRIQINV